ncbi:MAG: ABC transporter permease [Thaumarchaeota archaeon]|nr:MAG: ABC transporter permease [Nitrososphaerota archaeon]
MLEEKTQLDKRRSKAKLDVTDAANVALFLAAFVGIWQFVFLLRIWPEFLMPSPAMVLGSITNLVANSSLVVGTGVTLLRLAAGFLMSIGIGGAVGLAMVKFPGFGKTMSSFAVGLLTFPSIAWAIFAILPFGYNDMAILFVIVMASVFSVMITTYSSIRNIPPIYLRAASNMGAKGFALFQHVMIPAATPSLILGIRQAWSFAWHALIGAEILITITSEPGLGYVMSSARNFHFMGDIITVMITIFAIGIVFDRVLFRKVEEKVRSRWGLDDRSE